MNKFKRFIYRLLRKPLIVKPVVSDNVFIFNLLEKILNKQEEDIINYMNDVMTQSERNKHSENIWLYLLHAKGTLAEIRMKMLADGRKIN